jgi:hypothetical protein
VQSSRPPRGVKSFLARFDQSRKFPKPGFSEILAGAPENFAAGFDCSGFCEVRSGAGALKIPPRVFSVARFAIWRVALAGILPWSVRSFCRGVRFAVRCGAAFREQVRESAWRWCRRVLRHLSASFLRGEFVRIGGFSICEPGRSQTSLYDLIAAAFVKSARERVP